MSNVHIHIILYPVLETALFIKIYCTKTEAKQYF